MMQRILLSLAVAAAVGGGAIASTGAFFSDSETSTGNSFTAGAIDLKVDSEQHYNGNVCTLIPENTDTQIPAHYEWVGNADYPVAGTTCDGTWSLTDLQDGVQKFFNFTDVKPGDSGEDTLSLHIDSNPAWACADITVTKNADVTCTSPENAAEGAGVCGSGDPNMNGELAQNLNFFAWLDQGSIPGFQGKGEDPSEGDNIWQAGEPPLFANVVGPLSDAIGGKHYTLADATTGIPLPAGATDYIGLAWCAGSLDASVPGTLTCNGAAMGNEAQTDTAVADVTFRVEQSRNNAGFLCNPPV